MSDATVRWYHRLAAWICEHLHGLAAHAWMDMEKVECDDDEVRESAEDAAYWHGYEKAMEEMEREERLEREP